MADPTVVFRVTCTADDPQAPARILGIFAARSLLPQRFSSLWVGPSELIEIEIECEYSEDLIPEHLARVLDRIPTVTDVKLVVDGQKIAVAPIFTDA